MIWSSLRPLDRANHRFVGFNDDNIDPLFEQHLRISDAAPEIAVHRDARVLPCNQLLPDIWEAGGILDAGGDLIPLVRDWTPCGQSILGMREPVAAEPAETVDGDVLYLGWLFDNFGHRLIESLARVWALALVPKTTPVLFHYWPGAEPSADALELLELFGISRDRIIIPQRPAVYRSLLIPDPLIMLNTIVHERAGEVLRDVADRIAGRAAPGDQPLYLSRTALSGRQREVVGETALEDLLRDNGFQIVHPERLPLAEQIRLVASHRTIAVANGSAAHLLLFARPGSRVHLFGHLPLLEVNVLTVQAAGLRAVYHNALRWLANPMHGVRLDFPAIIAALSADGLLPNLARTPYLPDDAALDAEFEESWLFNLLLWPLTHHAETLDAAEAVIGRLRPSAWPAFVALAARMPPERMTDPQADALMALFAAALAEEPDAERRCRFAEPVRALAPLALARCAAETQALASAAIAARLPMTS